MDTNINIKEKSGNVWPSVVVGCGIGGTVGYLFMSESGRKIRRAITHPDEMADNIEQVRTFIQTTTQMVTNPVHNVLQKAKDGIQEGERAYHEAGQRFQARVHEFRGKTLENIHRTAVMIDQDVMNPICELGALYRGIERGIQTLLRKERAIYRIKGD
jgi:hypothetical protein